MLSKCLLIKLIFFRIVNSTTQYLWEGEWKLSITGRWWTSTTKIQKFTDDVDVFQVSECRLLRKQMSLAVEGTVATSLSKTQFYIKLPKTAQRQRQSSTLNVHENVHLTLSNEKNRTSLILFANITAIFKSHDGFFFSLFYGGVFKNFDFEKNAFHHKM